MPIFSGKKEDFMRKNDMSICVTCFCNVRFLFSMSSCRFRALRGGRLCRNMLLLVFLVVSFVGICADSMHEEAKFSEALEVVLKKLSEKEYSEPSQRRDILVAKSNAVKLALKNAGTELSHCVYANVIEDEIQDKIVNPKLNEIGQKRKLLKGDATEMRRLKDEYVQICLKREEGMWNRWMNDMTPLVAKYVLGTPDGELFIPPSVVEATAESWRDSAVLEEDNEETLSFCGFKLDSSFEGLWRTNIPLVVNEPFLGTKAARGFIEDGRLKEIVFYYRPVSNLSYKKLIKEACNEMRAFVEYKNKAWGVSRESDDVSNTARIYLNIIRKNARYVFCVDQSHCVYRNEILRFVTVRVMLANYIKRTEKRSGERTNIESKTLASSKMKEGVSSVARKNWIRKHIKSFALTQYAKVVQKDYREKLSRVTDLAADLALIFSDDNRSDDCAKQIERFYASRRDWSCLDVEVQSRFDAIFDKVLKLMKDIIVDNGEDENLMERRDKLWLNCVCHVNTWDELNAKLEAEKIAEEKRKEERDYLLRERKVRAEEDRNAILNGIRNSIDNLPH